MHKDVQVGVEVIHDPFHPLFAEWLKLLGEQGGGYHFPEDSVGQVGQGLVVKYQGIVYPPSGHYQGGYIEFKVVIVNALAG